MRPPIDLRRHLLHVTNVPAAEYAAAGYSPTAGLPLGVAIGRGRLFAPMSYAFWQMMLVEGDLPPIEFNWRAVSQFHPRRTMVIAHSGGTPEALMQIDERYYLRDLEFRRGPLVYVSFLEVAPWNKTASPRRRYRGLGQLLLRFACHRSQALGHKGVIGLHSLPAAEGFYRRLGFEQRNSWNEYHEPYFELTEAAARRIGWVGDQ